MKWQGYLQMKMFKFKFKSGHYFYFSHKTEFVFWFLQFISACFNVIHLFIDIVCVHNFCC